MTLNSVEVAGLRIVFDGACSDYMPHMVAAVHAAMDGAGSDRMWTADLRKRLDARSVFPADLSDWAQHNRLKRAFARSVEVHGWVYSWGVRETANRREKSTFISRVRGALTNSRSDPPPVSPVSVAAMAPALTMLGVPHAQAPLPANYGWPEAAQQAPANFEQRLAALEQIVTRLARAVEQPDIGYADQKPECSALEKDLCVRFVTLTKRVEKIRVEFFRLPGAAAILAEYEAEQERTRAEVFGNDDLT